MKYLLHSSNAAYNPTKQSWIFNLEERISRANVVQVSRAHFTSSSDQSPHPDVVYMCSSALSHLISEKHTVSLRNAGHRNDTHVIAVLFESHTRGRYIMDRSSKMLQCNPNHVSRTIDIYFTDGSGTKLDGEYSSSGGGGGAAAAGNDSEIDAISTDLLAWIDYDNTRVLDAAFQQSTGAGSDAQYIYNRGPNALLIFANQYGAAMQLANFGSTLALHQTGSWQSAADSTPVDYTNLNDIFSVHFLFSVTGANNFCYLFDLYMMRIIMYSGSLQFYDAAGNRNVVQGITIIPLQNYLVSCTRSSDGQGAFEVDWRVEKLSDGTVMTATTGSGLTFPGQIARLWRLGSASTHFTQYQGPFIVHNGESATHIASCQNWLKNKYNGVDTTTASASQEEEAAAAGSGDEHATFFTQLKIN